MSRAVICHSGAMICRQILLTGLALPQVQFKQEVQETFLRGVQQELEHHLAHMELNNLKIAEDKSFADIARYIFTTVLSLALPARPNIKAEYRGMYPASLPNVSTAVRPRGLIPLHVDCYGQALLMAARRLPLCTAEVAS